MSVKCGVLNQITHQVSVREFYFQSVSRKLQPKMWSDIVIEHDDVIKWKHFPRYWPFVRGIHRSPVNSPNKGQWRGALMSSLICAWINAWVNNREAGDLKRYRAHCDVSVMGHQVHTWLGITDTNRNLDLNMSIFQSAISWWLCSAMPSIGHMQAQYHRPCQSGGLYWTTILVSYLYFIGP